MLSSIKCSVHVLTVCDARCFSTFCLVSEVNKHIYPVLRERERKKTCVNWKAALVSEKSSNQLQVTQLSVETEKRVKCSDNTLSHECPSLASTTILYQILLSS